MLSIPLDASTKLGEVRQGANKAACFLSFFLNVLLRHEHAVPDRNAASLSIKF